MNDRFYAHGDGISFPTFGLITIECIGRFDHSELPSGTLLYPNAISYVGELQDLRPHGTGVLTHPDGRSFKGEWINDKSVSGELRLAPASRCSAFFGAGEQKKDVRFIGERDPLDLPHGMGCEVDAAGKIIPRRCGRWIHGSLALETFVPLSLLPPDTFVEERGQSSHCAWYCRVCFNADDRSCCLFRVCFSQFAGHCCCGRMVCGIEASWTVIIYRMVRGACSLLTAE